VIHACSSQRFIDWSFEHYLRIAPPQFAQAAPPRQPRRELAAAA
jgi:hypothetical protein